MSELPWFPIWVDDFLTSRTVGDARPEGPADWNQRQEGPCPVCGAVLQLAPMAGSEVWDMKLGEWRAREKADPPPTKRYAVIHDANAHRIAGEPMVGLSNRRET